MSRNGYIQLVVMIATCLVFSCKETDMGVVAWVDGHPVSDSEMNHWMLLQRAEVYNYFYREYGINDGDDFWQKTHFGESPLEMLKELALEKAVTCKVQQILALKKKVIHQIYFDSIVSEMNAVNQAQSERIRSGKVIYGPKKYTQRTYFSRVFDKMVIDLKEELLTSELRIPDMQLEMLEASDRDSIQDYSGFYRKQFVDENYDAFIDSLKAMTEVIINRKRWSNIKAEFN